LTRQISNAVMHGHVRQAFTHVYSVNVTHKNPLFKLGSRKLKYMA